MVKAVIFDVDGTLAETERDGHRVAFNRAFAEAGLPWHWDVALYGDLLAVTGGKERIACFAQRIAPRWLERDRSAGRIAELHARKNAHYAAIVEAGELRLRPGVPRLLDALETAGIRLAIATTTSRRNLDVLLRKTLGTRALSRFDPVVCGEDVERKKPDPEAYELAVRQLGLMSAQCVAVEDSANGLRAALAAGVPALVVRSLYTPVTRTSAALCGSSTATPRATPAPTPAAHCRRTSSSPACKPHIGAAANGRHRARGRDAVPTDDPLPRQASAGTSWQGIGRPDCSGTACIVRRLVARPRGVDGRCSKISNDGSCRPIAGC